MGLKLRNGVVGTNKWHYQTIQHERLSHDEGNPEHIVQQTFHASAYERIPSTALQVMMGRAPPIAVSGLSSAGKEGWNIDQFDQGQMRVIVKELLKWQEALHKDVLRQVAGR